MALTQQGNLVGRAGGARTILNGYYGRDDGGGFLSAMRRERVVLSEHGRAECRYS
jgi:hypothetical protein